MKTELLQEAYRLSEDRLQAQSKFALASDQRSLLFSGISIAAAALTAGTVSLENDNFAFYISVVFFLLSSAFSVVSAIPSAIHVSGNNFSDTIDSLKEEDAIDDLFNLFGRGNDMKIKKNEKNQKNSITLYFTAILFFLFACAFFSINLWISR